VEPCGSTGLSIKGKTSAIGGLETMEPAALLSVVTLSPSVFIRYGEGADDRRSQRNHAREIRAGRVEAIDPNITEEFFEQAVKPACISPERGQMGTADPQRRGRPAVPGRTSRPFDHIRMISGETMRRSVVFVTDALIKASWLKGIVANVSWTRRRRTCLYDYLLRYSRSFS
jgi:hypothetical protein